ncbi:MAG: hypothetical protein ABEJ98_01150 [Candidatus Nanohaloarchaea archaeon]
MGKDDGSYEHQQPGRVKSSGKYNSTVENVKQYVRENPSSVINRVKNKLK